MSLSDIRPYFRNKLETLGYKEHRDALNFNNIPGNLIDTYFHLETVSISSGAADQLVHTFAFDLNVRLFRRSYNDTVETHEELVGLIEQVHASVLTLIGRAEAPLFDIIPGASNIEAIGDTNDNLQVAVMPFTAIVKLCF